MVAGYKFRVGTRVRFTKAAFDTVAKGEMYEVTDRLPLQGIEFEYRIHHCTGPDERVARESQLHAVG
jgi:hypothetical protein